MSAVSFSGLTSTFAWHLRTGGVPLTPKIPLVCCLFSTSSTVPCITGHCALGCLDGYFNGMDIHSYWISALRCRVIVLHESPLSLASPVFQASLPALSRNACFISLVYFQSHVPPSRWMTFLHLEEHVRRSLTIEFGIDHEIGSNQKFYSAIVVLRSRRSEKGNYKTQSAAGASCSF